MSSTSDDAFLAGPFEPRRDASAAEPQQTGTGLDFLSEGEPVTPPPARRRAPLPVAALVATGWAGVLSYAAVLALFAMGFGGSSGSGPMETVRLAATGWLLAHGVPIETPADRLTLIPLSLTLLAVWRLARAGIHVSRALGGHRARTALRALGAGAAVGFVYAAFGGATAVLVTTPEVRVSWAAAAFSLGALGAVAAGVGAFGHSMAGRQLIHRIPPAIGDALRAGVLAAALLLATGAAGAGMSLALHGGDAAAVLHGFKAGLTGQAGITLACLAYAPNAAVWAVSYLIGPGFAVGVGTTVSQSMVVVGPVPALPLLPAVPDAPVAGIGPALLPAPLLAALAAGALLGRRRRVGWRSLIGSALLAAPIAGLLLAVAAWASAGGLGWGRLAEIGPSAWPVGVWGTAVAGAGLVIGALAARTLAGLRPPT
jgi:hypothetical protein